MAPATPDANDLHDIELSAAPRQASDDPYAGTAGHSPASGRTYSPSESPVARTRASPLNGLNGEGISGSRSGSAMDPETGSLGGRIPGGSTDADDDIGLLGGGTLRRQLTAPKLPRWLGPAGTAGALFLLLVLASVALRRASSARRVSDTAMQLSSALITDRLNRVRVVMSKMLFCLIYANKLCYHTCNRRQPQRTGELCRESIVSGCLFQQLSAMRDCRC